MAKTRSFIVKASKRDATYMEYISKKEQKKTQHLKKYLHDELARKQNRKNLLSLMTKESQYWLSNPDYWNKRAFYSLIPNNFESQSDYYIKLQEVS